MNNPDLSVDIGGIKLKNPVMTASGTFGYAMEFQPFFDLNELGAIIVKGLSLRPTKGNPPPRIVETASGMLNAIGLENVGLDAFLKLKLPFLKSLRVPFIVNIYGKSIEEYCELAGQLNDIEEIKGIELNISCPNVKSGGIAFGVDPDEVFKIVEAVRLKTIKPLMVKLSPNVTDIVAIAKNAESAGADSLSLINTITGMAVDIEERRPILANITGGLSGPAIKPIALRMLWEVVKNVKIPVIGVGGIVSATDALEFLMTGAAAVQIGTGNFMNPRITMDILNGIKSYLVAKEIDDIKKFIGTLQYKH